MIMELWWADTDRGITKFSGKSLCQCHFVENHRYTKLELNPSLNCEKTAADCLRHDTASRPIITEKVLTEDTRHSAI
jgi:hypothetical protein